MVDRVHIEDPPPDRRPPTLGDLLYLIAADQPPKTWARIKTFDKATSARVLASQLRHGARAPDRPAGGWEFVVRQLFDDDLDAGRYGLWARYTPPTE